MEATREVVRRRRVVVDERHIALAIGARIRAARTAARLTQQQLAGDRYTKAYVSALELGHAKPSMAALNYLAPRLGTTPDRLVADASVPWTRLEADLKLSTGNVVEAADAYQLLAELATDPLDRASLLMGLAEARCRLGSGDEAIRVASEARKTFLDIGRTGDAARATYWLAVGHHLLDDADEARRLLRDLLDVDGEDAPDPDFQIRVRIAIAQVEAFRGEHRAALGFLEEARGGAEELDLRRRGTFYDSLARMRAATGDYEGAIRAGTKALVLFQTSEADREVVLLENQLALAYMHLGNLRKAQSVISHAKHAAKEIDDEVLTSYLTDTDASIALASGDHERALQLAGEALEMAEAMNDRRARLDALVTRARTYMAMGRHADAAQTSELAAAVADGSSPLRKREVYTTWADALAADGRHAEAYAIARKAMTTPAGLD